MTPRRVCGREGGEGGESGEGGTAGAGEQGCNRARHRTLPPVRPALLRDEGEAAKGAAKGEAKGEAMGEAMVLPVAPPRGRLVLDASILSPVVSGRCVEGEGPLAAESAAVLAAVVLAAVPAMVRGVVGWARMRGERGGDLSGSTLQCTVSHRHSPHRA